MDYLPVMLLVLILLLVSLYWLEVHAGSGIGMYAVESGLSTADQPLTKTTTGQFLGGLAPLQLGMIAVPLLFREFWAGILLLALALVLFCRYRKDWGDRV